MSAIEIACRFGCIVDIDQESMGLFCSAGACTRRGPLRRSCLQPVIHTRTHWSHHELMNASRLSGTTFARKTPSRMPHRGQRGLVVISAGEFADRFYRAHASYVDRMTKTPCKRPSGARVTLDPRAVSCSCERACRVARAALRERCRRPVPFSAYTREGSCWCSAWSSPETPGR